MRNLITILALFLVCSLSAQQYTAVRYVSTDFPQGKTLRAGSHVIVTTTAVYFDLDFADPAIDDIEDLTVPFYYSEPVGRGTGYIVPQTYAPGESHFMWLGYMPGPDFDFVMSYQAWDTSVQTNYSTSNIILIP
jgi:hypothetical protein